MRCKTWHVQALGSTLGKRPIHFAPSFTLHAGWDTDVVAEAQAAILSHRRKPHTEDDRALPGPTEPCICPDLTDLGLVLCRKPTNFCLRCSILLHFPKYAQFYFGMIGLQKLHILNVYHLMSLNICMYLWNTAVRVIDVLSSPKFPGAFLLLLLFLLFL